MAKLLYSKTRYIVPFIFQIQEKECFNGLVEKMDSSQEWNLRDMYDTGIECDLYSIILDSFTMDQKGCNIGCALSYDLKQKDKVSLNYTRFDRDFNISLEKMEMFLFRTGVGFLWYEMQMPTDMTMDELILFQNEFKELTYKRFVSKDYRTKRYTFEIEPERKEAFLMGHWIDEVLACIPFTYTYFASRKDPLDDSKVIADKALLYNYAVFDKLEDELWDDMYRITNGYNKRYIIRKNIESEYKEFFHNANCYASTGGVGYYVVPEKDNKRFYMGIFQKKIQNDYFLLNILALYQSYSILKFTKNMEKELSADSERYLTDSEEILRALQKLETEINVFLIKSVYSSVSHIGHQNEYYEYLMKQWRIRENIEGLTIGLESLQKLQEAREAERLEEIEHQENIEREKSNDKLSIGLGMISILAIVSAISDGYGAIEIVMELLSLPESVKSVMVAGLVVIVIIIAVVAVTSIVQSVNRGRKKHRNK